MFKLSTKSRYGTRLLIDLATHQNKGYILLKEIAKRQKISIKYLEQIVSILKSSNFVEAYRGAQGGYKLAKNPSDITLKEIVETLEGNLSLVKCIDAPECCNNVKTCPSRDAWKIVQDKINNTLSNISLSDLLSEEKNALKINY